MFCYQSGFHLPTRVINNEQFRALIKAPRTVKLVKEARAALAEGNKALCELHCLANVIEILPAEQAAERMVQLGSKTSCFIP